MSGYYLPILQPWETVYGWCSTVSKMASHTNDRVSAGLLLGAAHANRQHDIPSRLGYLLSQLPGSLPSANDCLREHTLAGYYMPFIQDGRRTELVQSLLISDSQFSRRGLLQWSRTLRVKTPLKYCVECVASDLHKIGRPLWITAHQFPTTRVCLVHRTLLLEVVSHRNSWTLPGDEEGTADSWHQNIDFAVVLASIGGELPSISTISGPGIRAEAIQRLKDLGVIISGKGVSHQMLEKWFQSTEAGRFCAAAPGPPFSLLARGEWIPSLLWRRHSMSAIRWVIFWSALSWTRAASAAKAFTAASRGSATDIQGQHLLFGSASDYLPAPSIVYAAFDEANSYQEAMKMLGASRGRLVRWLEDDPSLRKRWRSRLRDQRLEPVIDRLRNRIKAEPLVSRDKFVRQNSSDFKWLKDHFPDTHYELLKGLPARLQAQAVLFRP
ncbi:MAG: TniQ family protein [Polaromonas sp.]|uniref:TniQ family protein n=1 Tax=Polaromonas sp. TaxID=1869339 RepID=UPI00273206B5|nr:TniQ family protein [Polaromonas sp.]MDP2452089.1 TniQ family protein [Polaromonas sp.]MDP3247670.1 TniQ family protein [Polaromonas sp.]MDP3755316.1 TniQ family protein [Polaromonas sp.]MDP3827444.1 TniQ family protein [Polaromonas sp.]